MQIASPVCWQFGKKALMICAAKLKLHLPDMVRDMSIAVYDYAQMVAHVCKTASEDNVMVFVTLGQTFVYIYIYMWLACIYVVLV